MNCQQSKPLLHAYHDHELDAANRLVIEAHLQKCSACRQEYQDIVDLSDQLNSSIAMEPAPEDLRQSVQDLVHDKPEPRRPLYKLPIRQVALALSMGFAVLLAVATVFHIQHAKNEEIIINEVFNGHIRSLNTGTLTQLNSSSTKDLLSWFNSRLDYSPNVKDLADNGYRLIGGRLDYLQQRQIASISYEHDGHFINLYTWPSPEVDDAEQELHRKNGYKLIYWCQNNMNYWVVSDLETEQLESFVGRLKSKLTH